MTRDDRLPHLDAKGEVHIVDIAGKPETRRRAVAEARLLTTPETARALLDNALAKGDALAVARVAGMMAAKKTSELIPLCHTIALTSVGIDISALPDGTGLHIRATAETTGRTGVEMEALTAASVASLTLYDMAKSRDRGLTITDLRLVEKSGGASGDYERPA